MTTRILRLAGGGDGVGKLPDGRTVFVPRTAPGDLVELTDLVLRKRFARARVGRLVEPAPTRVTPRCPHYQADQCGGCQMQHLSQPAQLEAKRAFVGDALRRLGGFDVPDPKIVAAAAAWGYRAKLTLAVADRARVIGLHRADHPDRVFDLARCDIAAPELMLLWTALRERRRALPAEATKLVLRLDRAGTRHVIVEVEGTRVWDGAKQLAAELTAAGAAAVLWWHPEGGAARVVAGNGAGAYPATVFEQVNPALGDRIRTWAVEQLGDAAGRHVWDLYAGIGETTTRLLERGATVESVEVDGRAVRLGQGSSQEAAPEGTPAVRQSGGGSTNVTRHIGRVEDLVDRMRPPHLVITNPPRTGMDPRVVDAVREAGPTRVVYVSCDPATLARDLKRLASGSSGPSFYLAGVRAFDLFPQTAHVETVAVLGSMRP